MAPLRRRGREAIHDAMGQRVLLAPRAQRRLNARRQIGRLPVGALEERRHQDFIKKSRLRSFDELAGLLFRQRSLEMLLDQEVKARVIHDEASMHFRSVSRTRKRVVATHESDWPMCLA